MGRGRGRKDGVEMNLWTPAPPSPAIAPGTLEKAGRALQDKSKEESTAPALQLREGGW